MALSEEGNGGIPATMLVGPANVGNGGMAYPYPVYGGMGGGSGMGNGFGDGAWIILLVIVLLAAGGWGNNGNGGGFGQPVVINEGSGSVQRGFDQAAIMAALSGIQSGICSGFGDVQTALCGGFAGVNATVNSGVNTITQQMYTNQIADMQNSFALQSQLANCCCENRLATNDLKYTIATEACNDRAAFTQGFQTILDKLCQLELDGYKRDNDNLRSQLNMSALRESQTAQTAQILAGQTAEVDALYNRLSQCPIPAEPVYGRQAIFTCPNNNNNGCGCGCGGNF